MCEISWTLVLEYLRVFLSWPFLTFATLFVLSARFRPELGRLIDRIRKVNFAGAAISAAASQTSLTAAEDPLQAFENAIALEAKEATSQGLPPSLIGDPDAPKAIELIKKHPAAAVAQFKALYFDYSAEKLLNRIFGTQVSMLEWLADIRPLEGARLDEVAEFHKRHQQLAGREDYQLRSYLEFLLSFGVLTVEGTPAQPIYKITAPGLFFLSYIKANYPTIWNQKAY